ncbi:MAG: type II toxin-antitoxin system Phd/YefM family antitoxin [Micropruina sp.]|uniref:type II toxin-antitoxin system Phd/YefM family antitoxin n=1 Tax=Micropruina sp. TaxID=2737536 RepID=UPI0039E350D6
MRTITMTELNQRVSAVTREVVETGEAICVTNRGKVVLRLVPEPVGSSDPLAALVSAGRATPPRAGGSRLTRREPIPLSRPLDELLADERDDDRF